MTFSKGCLQMGLIVFAPLFYFGDIEEGLRELFFSILLLAFHLRKTKPINLQGPLPCIQLSRKKNPG